MSTYSGEHQGYRLEMERAAQGKVSIWRTKAYRLVRGGYLRELPKRGLHVCFELTEQGRIWLAKDRVLR